MRVLPLRWWRLALMTPVGFSSSLLTTPLTQPHESVPLSDLTQQLIRRAMPCPRKAWARCRLSRQRARQQFAA